MKVSGRSWNRTTCRSPIGGALHPRALVAGAQGGYDICRQRAARTLELSDETGILLQPGLHERAAVGRTGPANRVVRRAQTMLDRLQQLATQVGA